jgi:hypothetical protein
MLCHGRSAEGAGSPVRSVELDSRELRADATMIFRIIEDLARAIRLKWVFFGTGVGDRILTSILGIGAISTI